MIPHLKKFGAFEHFLLAAGYLTPREQGDAPPPVLPSVEFGGVRTKPLGVQFGGLFRVVVDQGPKRPRFAVSKYSLRLVSYVWTLFRPIFPRI